MKLIDPRVYAIEGRIKDIKRIWAVSSGKGGVGKSTLSTFISLLLNKRGYKAGLLDLDFYGPSSHLILGANNIKPIEDYGLRPADIEGIKFMSIIYFTENRPLAMRGKDISNVLIELLTITRWNNLDFLIIDMPPGMGEILLDIIRYISNLEFLVISNSSTISMETVEKLIKFLNSQNIPILGVIENMKFVPSEYIKNKCYELNIKYLGEISFCPEIENYYGNIEKLLDLRISKELNNILSFLI
ncbi:MAG: Mrp/NBP35 family ATP-binding protein [Dictyoglomus sp.]|nr:Mrp/NBP35 family ATP-binding protein [Dictyoglomus sp.]MDW8189243.1 P-loop NTPase [Dictyoglomus sp.]